MVLLSGGEAEARAPTRCPPHKTKVFASAKACGDAVCVREIPHRERTPSALRRVLAFFAQTGAVTIPHLRAFPARAEQVSGQPQGVREMNGIHKFSAHVIDYAERLSDVADAAQGKSRRQAGAVAGCSFRPAWRSTRSSGATHSRARRRTSWMTRSTRRRVARGADRIVRQTTDRSTGETGSRSPDRLQPSERSPRRAGGAPRGSRPLPSAKARRQQASSSNRAAVHCQGRFGCAHSGRFAGLSRRAQPEACACREGGTLANAQGERQQAPSGVRA